MFDHLGVRGLEECFRSVHARLGPCDGGMHLVVALQAPEGSGDSATSPRMNVHRENEAASLSPAEVEHLRGLIRRDKPLEVMDADLTPSADHILEETFPHNFRMPKVELFDGSAAPLDHLALYSSWARNHGYSDAIKCRLFNATLLGEAKKWWNKLPTGSI